MPSYYVYLISSLPFLSFSAKPPFGLAEFYARCRDLIPEKEYKILSGLGEEKDYFLSPRLPAVLKEWAAFEITLRNELARARAGRKKTDPLKFLRLPEAPQAEISHVAMNAYRSASVLEAEKILDQARWDFLENLSCGHYFDFKHLALYALKLMILERWEKIQKADKEYLLNGVIAN
ncbi:MAG: DUF2764 family protein [Candidatus Omnitrophica bacterium]|jgi:hypothetical protein|nr:DUF2764 domain-containing protein [Candidatus Omnitrophota bacterium]MDD5077455.1 DUF2764 family protein [Candidatus Omnitrophota bacterium]